MAAGAGIRVALPSSPPRLGGRACRSGAAMVCGAGVAVGHRAAVLSALLLRRCIMFQAAGALMSCPLRRSLAASILHACKNSLQDSRPCHVIHPGEVVSR